MKYAALPLVVLAMMAFALLPHRGAHGVAPVAQTSGVASSESIVAEARALSAQTRTHVSYAAFLSSLSARLRVIGATCAEIDVGAMDAPDALGGRTVSYRNAAVAAQQGFEVVIEKAGTWPESKLRVLLTGAREKLEEAEALRADVAPQLIRSVLREGSPVELGEISSGRWSGFREGVAEDSAPTAPDKAKPAGEK